MGETPPATVRPPSALTFIAAPPEWEGQTIVPTLASFTFSLACWLQFRHARPPVGWDIGMDDFGWLCQIDPSRLMCRRHWYRVPKPLRDQVWATWRSGQGVLSNEHQDAVRIAMATCQGQSRPVGCLGTQFVSKGT